MESKTILFVPGCDWLVCKVEDDPVTNIKNIYIREVNLGISGVPGTSGRDIVLWLDDRILRPAYNRYHWWINDWNGRSMNPEVEHKQVILKTHSETAMAYLQSPFFRISLNMCRSFKIVQSQTRTNENLIRTSRHPSEVREEMAGPLFFEALKMEMKNMITQLYR